MARGAAPDAWNRGLGGGRAIGFGVRGVSIGELHDRGWDVDDVGLDELYPIRDFESLERAVAQAECDLPAGSAVSWRGIQGRLGGFVTGFRGVGPGVVGELPVLVIWPEPPDGVELTVDGWSELKSVLLERLDRLVDFARGNAWPQALADLPRISDGQLDAGRQRAVAALEQMEAERRLIPGIGGPVEDVRGSAGVWPMHGLRWDGFADGWRGEELALAVGGHPIATRCLPTTTARATASTARVSRRGRRANRSRSDEGLAASLATKRFRAR